MAEDSVSDIKNYSGEQIVLASGRLVFNSRLNDIYINSFRYINLSAGDKVTIDVGKIDSDKEENMFLVNAPKIQFGLDRYGVAQKVVKADELQKILIELMTEITTYAEMVKSAAAVPSMMSITLILANEYLKGKFEVIKIKLDDFKSKITYTI
jgi:hypothetical protein